MMHYKIVFVCATLICAFLNLPLCSGQEIECPEPNEHYDCGSACQTTCQNYNETCPIINVRCNDDCYCDENFARDNSGKCIPVEDCDQIPEIRCGPNEHSECIGACQRTCENFRKPCNIISKTCNKGCHCNKGYARNRSGRCIPIERCPRPRPCS